MKVYASSMEAIRDHLQWLESTCELKPNELERSQIAAGIAPDKVVSADMIRFFLKGRIKNFSAERAESFCRVLGMDVLILHRN
jgi:hypothetical protein